MDSRINDLYEFGDFKFSTSKGKLWNENGLILLSPKSTELLKLLLEKNGEFVSKEEIFENVWSNTFVEDGVLTQNIYTLRKALGNDENGFPIIENKTRLGYRITVPIICHADLEKPDSVSTSDELLDRELVENSENSPRKFSSRRFRISVIAFVAIISFSTIGFLFFRQSITAFFRKSIDSIQFTRLTNTGDLANATLSPDGNVVAFIKGNDVFLKDILTNKDIKIDIPNVDSLSSLQFSPDGNLLYFRNNKIFNTFAKIFKISRFGGESELIADNTWGSFSISPDGKRLAFFRLRIDQGGDIDLIVFNMENKEEKAFQAIQTPNSNCGNCSPAWSPDGKKIIFTTNTPNAGQLNLLDLTNGKIEELKLQKLRRFEQVAWFPDGESFLVSASDGNRFLHLWKVYYPNLDVQAMTNGLLTYGKISISANGKKILAIQSSDNSNIFVADADNLKEQKQLTFGNQNTFGQTSLNWITDQKLACSTQTEENPTETLAVIDSLDGSKFQISNELEASYSLPTSDGKYIYFFANKNGFANIYQMTIDGKNVIPITNGTDGQRTSPRVTNDGRFLFYRFRSKEQSQIRRFNLQTNTEEVFFDNPEFGVSPFIELSPDNKFITFLRIADRKNFDSKFDKFNAGMTVVSTDNTNDIKWFPVSMVLPVRRFSPDNKALDYILAETDGTQIVRQSFDGGNLHPIYTINDGRIFNFAWSKNGKKLAISRGQQFRDAVLLSDFDK